MYANFGASLQNFWFAGWRDNKIDSFGNFLPVLISYSSEKKVVHILNFIQTIYLNVIKI